MPGGGPAGATLGLLEYLSQSNNNADCVDPEDRFKFVDDLTTLEIVNLLTVGMSCYNVKLQVPNDILEHNQYIPAENLESQKYLDTISDWTIGQKMKINQKKTKSMLFNFTNNHQFTTRLSLNGEIVENVSEIKLLGTVIQSDLSWNSNTSRLVKRANARMVLLRKLCEFGAPIHDLKTIYVTYIRSILEQSAVVWHSGLSEENKQDLSRVQKSACKIILKNNYQDYENALNILDLETLNERRHKLCETFAKKCVTNGTISFPLIDKSKYINTRSTDKYIVQHCNTERLKKSAIPNMQRLLNQLEKPHP